MAPLLQSSYKVTMEDYDKQGCLHEMFIKQAKATPNNIAIVTNDGQKVTYAELDKLTDILALKLRHLGVTNNTVVGIIMERSLEYAISYISIHKAGGAYLPIEVSYPLPLLQSVLEDSEPVAICAKSQFAEKLYQFYDKNRVILLEGKWSDNYKLLPPISKPVQSNLDDLAYTVYSSGTTGKPKGIQCPHRGAVFSYHWRHVAYPYDDEEREACNVFFVWEMLRPLLKGKTLYIIPDDVIYDPPKLVAFLSEHKITRMLFTPSLLEAVLDYKGLDTKIKNAFKYMRQIWFCGEVLTTILRDRCVKLFPHVKMLNLYSISESHDISCAALTEDYDPKPRKFCPVGKLLPGVHVVIMDEDMNIQPVGAPGEIYVGGPTLAIGYLNRPDLNATRFIARPDNVPAQVGPRLYRTGDWGYVLSDGDLEICGRCNSMVKIRGYSIEIQAVESALLDLPMVNSGCVLVLGEEGTDKFLVAYIVPEGETSRKEVRAALKKKLPFYMIPSKFIFLSSIPLVESSSKLDKNALPKIDVNEDSGIDPQDLPSTPMEHLIANIWCNILYLPAIDVQENFFDLGGHSLLASRLLSEMNEKLGLNLELLDLFKYPTVSSMASFVENPSAVNGDLNQLDLTGEVERHSQGKDVMDISLRAFWRSFQVSNPKLKRENILLTGVTGFVGAFILKELLTSTKSTVYCLVRDAPGLSPLDRIKKTLNDYNLLKCEVNGENVENKLERKVVPIKGDIALVNLGLSDDEYMYLSYEVDIIIHSAATVNLIYPYRALHSSNVVGTDNILKFSLLNKIKPLHHISTNAVFPDGLENCSEDDDMKQYSDKLDSGYSQSKWVAEQLVSKSRAKGHPISIYRCGNVAGSLEVPSWNPADFTLLMLQGCITTKSAPNVNWQIELTPVDFISKVIVSLSKNIMLSIGKNFHLTNTKSMNCSLLWQLLKVEGYPVEVVPYKNWYEKVQQHARLKTEWSSTLKALLFLLDSLVLNENYFSNLSTYTQENLQTTLDELNLEYPPVNTDLMKKYLKHLSKIGFIPRPQRQLRGRALQLNGQVAFVTGASSGIGAETAKALALAGAKVAMIARRADRLKQLQEEIEKEGGMAVSIAIDITDENQVFSGVKHAESLLGPITILVNNAGFMYYTLMSKVQLQKWQQMVSVNINGTLNCYAAILKGMVERKKGHIVNISSDAGRKAFPGLAVYSGTKYFMEATARALREELVGTGVKVTCIQPGDVKTELHGHSTDKEVREMFDVSQKIKILEPSDIANSILYAVTQPDYCSINEILLEPREAPI